MASIWATNLSSFVNCKIQLFADNLTIKIIPIY